MADVIDITKSHLDVTGYVDGQMWIRHQGSSESDLSKRGFFPFTRYNCILNRPRVITESVRLADTPNMDFALVTSEVEDVPEDDIFALYKQSW